MSDTYQQLHVESAAQWRVWLESHHRSSPGVWLVTWKKGCGPTVSYDDVVDAALCFGWVDSRPRTIDDARSARLLTPRRVGSSWSRVNKRRVERLIRSGQMAPAGLMVVEAARRDGSWIALDEIEALREPDDLAAALDADPAARENWDGFPRSVKRAILEWISTAKADTTRARRVTQTARDAAQGRRANQWRQPKNAAPNPESR